MASINGSDESWGICSPKDIRSISSGIESNDFFDIESRTSNPNAPFNLLQTTESIDGTVDMEFAAESQGHSPSQTFLPHPTNITEWVQGQSIPMSEPSEPKAKSHNLLETTSGSAEVRRALSENLSQCSKVPSRSRSIYDISTLLAIGAVTPSDRMELRIRPAVLTEDIFKPRSHGGQSRSFEKARYRGFSEDSEVMGRGFRPDDEVVWSQSAWCYARPPFRQPLSPPDKTSSQQHEGFKRFLKQVASPPHQRVTAGGRIVPAGPQSPPPMMSFGSIDANIGGKFASEQSAKQNNKFSTQAEHSGASKSQPQLSVTSGDNEPGFSNNPQPLDQSVPVLRNPIAWNRGETFPAELSAILPAPAGMVPVLFLPAGDAIVFCNGVYSRIYYDGNGLFPEPLPINPSFITSSEHLISACSQVPRNAHAIPSFVGLNSHADVPTIYSRVGNQISRDALNKNHEMLQSQLSKLDRYMASQFHKLSPPELQHLASRRQQLVEQIDFLRVNKEKTLGKLPVSNLQSSHDSGVSQNLPFASSSYSAYQKDPGHSTNHTYSTGQTASTNFSLTGKSSCLSPDAPPFIPSTQAFCNGSNSYVNQESFGKHKKSGRKASPIQDSQMSKPITAQTKNISKNLEIQTSAKMDNQTSESFESASGDLTAAANSSSILAYEDVEYADRLGLNPPNGEKLFCSNIEEFSEVIRQVREQAEIYGCHGGQSKDAAYDAEEDILWAINNKIPIPLPAMVPDHIRRPRSWHWDDSFFNPVTHKDKRYPVEYQGSVDEASPNYDLAVDRRDVTRNPISRNIDFRPLAWAVEAFGYEAAIVALKTSPEAKSAALPLGSSLNSGTSANKDKKSSSNFRTYQDDKEFMSYLNDEFNPQLTDGGKYTVLYEDILLPIQHKDPHVMRKHSLVNPIFNTRTGELIFADNGPPGYQDDIDRYAEKYGENEAKKSTKFFGSPGNYQAMTSNSKSEVSSSMKVGECRNSSVDNSITYPMNNEAQSLEGKTPTSITKSDPACHSMYSTGNQVGTALQMNSAKSNGAQSFLQGMLKSPRFSQPRKRFVDWTPEEVRQNQMSIAGVNEYFENPTGMKENIELHSQPDGPAAYKTLSSTIRSSVPSKAGQDVRLQKAESSLASSNFNASGELPHLVRAGAYLESSSYQVGKRSPQHMAPGYYPSRPRASPRISKRDGNSKHLNLYSMGQYDGACDFSFEPTPLRNGVTGNYVSPINVSEQSATKDRGSTTNGGKEQPHLIFDHKGVSVDDFNTCGRVFPPGYKAAIARFFNKLRKEEHEINNRAQEGKAKNS